jgi:hypothetical protein
MAGADSDSDDVEIVEAPWEQVVLQNRDYKDPYNIFIGRKHGSPGLDKMRDLLLDFKGENADTFFIHGSKQSIEFANIVHIINASTKKSKATREKAWNQTYVSQVLAKIIVLRSMELSDREQLPSNQRVARGRSTLSRKIEKVWKIYEPCLKLFKDAELAHLNKKHKTPSLKYQETGPRMQDSYCFDVQMKDKNGCPRCAHFSTMGFDLSEVNAINSSRRLTAMAEGESTFDGLSSKHGCFCFSIDCHGSFDGKGCYVCEDLHKRGASQDMSVDVGFCLFSQCSICSHGKDREGCQCQVIFEEHYRQTIALAIKKNNEREEEKKKQAAFDGGGKKQQPEGTGATALYNRLNEW